MTVFADLILSNESDIKDHLRLIFIDISESLIEDESLGLKSSIGDSSGGEF